MQEIRFFELPSEDKIFDEYLSGIKAHGGCGEDLNGLEAAMFSNEVKTLRRESKIVK